MLKAMSAAAEILPLVLFFVAYKVLGMLAATAVAIVTVLIQVGVRMAQRRRVEPMLWITLAIVVVFGGATLISGDERYIKLKPSLIYWCAAVALVVARFGFGKDLIRQAFSNAFAPPDSVWPRLLVAWVVFLVALGALNLFVAQRYSSDVWVNFKLFGTMGLMLTFVALQIAALWRYRKEEE
ncbi:MAG TPA: septation protein A [Polyangiaceae bacterium]|jgi:intracellular septation protein|nr:septation protein A [Polyangiaceae bacterium]